MMFHSFLAQAPAVTTDSINAIFTSNIDAITSGFGQAQGAASQLFLALATLELLFFLYKAYLEPDLEELFEEGAKKIAMLVIVLVMTLNWGAIAGGMRGYLVGAGSGMVGQSGTVTSMNPAAIAAQGVDKIAIIFNEDAREQIVRGTIGTAQTDRISQDRRRRAEAENRSYFDVYKSGLDGFAEEITVGLEAMALEVLVLFVFAFVALLIVGVHFYVALQMFVLTLDWYLTVSITTLLIPFAANKHTSPLASSALNAVVGKSVQLAVMVMVLGMFGRALDGLALSAAPTLYEMLALLLGTSTLAFMIARVPSIARGIFASGGQAIDVGGLMVSAASGAASALASSALAGAQSVGGNPIGGSGGPDPMPVYVVDNPGGGSPGPTSGGNEVMPDALPEDVDMGEPFVVGNDGLVASSSNADFAMSQDARRSELESSNDLTDSIRQRDQGGQVSVEDALAELGQRDGFNGTPNESDARNYIEALDELDTPATEDSQDSKNPGEGW